MGQHTQIFVIAEIGNQYRWHVIPHYHWNANPKERLLMMILSGSLCAIDHSTLWNGFGPVKRCLRLLQIFEDPENR